MRRKITRFISIAAVAAMMLCLTACGNTNEKKDEAIDAFNSVTEIFDETTELINENNDSIDDELITIYQEMAELLTEYKELLESDEELTDEEYDEMIDWFKEAKDWATESKEVIETELANPTPDKSQEAIDAFNAATTVFDETAVLINANIDSIDDEVITLYQEMSSVLTECKELLESDTEITDEQYDELIASFNEIEVWATQSKSELESALAQ